MSVPYSFIPKNRDPAGLQSRATNRVNHAGQAHHPLPGRTDGRVVKGVKFVNLRDAGDPVELAERYNEQGADELVFLDITASSDHRDTMATSSPAPLASLHPAHGWRRDPLRRRRRIILPPAPTRSPSTPQLSPSVTDQRTAVEFGCAGRGAGDRRPPAPRPAAGASSPTAAATTRHRRHRVGAPGRTAGRRRDPA